MTYFQKQILFSVLGALLIGGGAWWWFAAMEKGWVAVPKISDAVRENPMLGAMRLLQSHRHPVTIEGTLHEALLNPLPRGTLLLPDNDGVMTPEQAAQILDWVRAGNTLIARPKWSAGTGYESCAEQAAAAGRDRKSAPSHDAAASDPIAAYLGVELIEMKRRSEETATAASASSPAASAPQKHADCLARLAVPSAGYPLYLNIDRMILDSTTNHLPPRFSDDRGLAMRVYDEGKGHIAMVADNYFDNRNLPRYDHAELLLTLGALNRDDARIMIVKRLDMRPWYRMLWLYFRQGLIGIGCATLLLLWIALRRFGPVLPEPDRERRSLIEHIDASARWLWTVPGGRDLLLASARNAIVTLLQRRAPELQRLPPAEQAARLAHACSLSVEEIDQALHQPASQMPLRFTRQIQTLQQLRKHHER